MKYRTSRQIASFHQCGGDGRELLLITPDLNVNCFRNKTERVTISFPSCFAQSNVTLDSFLLSLKQSQMTRVMS